MGHAEPILTERGLATTRGDRRLRYWLTRSVVVAAIASAAATAVVILVPPLHFAYEVPELHVALETAAALIGLLAAYLVFGRYRRSRNLADFALCYSLGLLAASNFVFAVIPAIVNSQPDRFGTWARICGALLGSAVLAFAAFAPPRRIRLGRSRLLAAMASIPAVLLLIAGFVFALGSRLPAGVELVPMTADASRPHINGSAAVLTAQIVGMGLLVLAALGFARKAERTRDELMTWLAVAAVFGAFARLNYFLYPSAYTDWVYFGDFFRLAFYVAILFAEVQEIRSYWERVSETAVLEERRRIARDLHDGLAQELAFISRNLRSLDGDDPAVSRVSASAARALSESRLAIAALTKPLDEPLEIALAQAARDTADREGTDIDLVLSPGVELDYRRRDALIRIACEAISNAARHGGASRVRVELVNGRQVHLHVTDDGCGFDPASVPPDGGDGFGLTSMRERAHSFGGAFEVRSRPGAGTQVDVTL